MMGCLPFFCCFKKFKPKTFCYIALVVNGIKINIPFICLFLLKIEIFIIGMFCNIFEIIFVFISIINILIITFNILRKRKKFKLMKLLCNIIIVLNILILLFHLLTLFAGIFYSNVVWKNFLIFLLLWICYLVAEIMHLLAFNYLLKLFKLKSFDSYDKYLKAGKNGEKISVNVTNVQIARNSQTITSNEVVSDIKI